VFLFISASGTFQKRDEVMTLADEDGDEWQAKCLPRKTRVSGGWKGFAEYLKC
ncbi:B3 domain-containing protein-like protein, partial [Tanacetum coccineum]